MMRKLFVFFTVLFTMAIGLLSSMGSVKIKAQVLVSATPAVITLPQVATDAPVVSDPLLFTATPTRTPTPQSGAYLEATEGEVNVRADASTDAERLGAIRPGDQYRIRGRYFQWLQFEYPNSPTGLGWVFDELVTITGDTATIADLSITPTANPLLNGVTLTPETSTSGGVVLAPVSDLANTGNLPVDVTAPTAEILPTYTFPPDVVAQAPTEGPSATPTLVSVLSDISVNNGIAPIVPIAVLGLFGLLGLIFSLMRSR